MRKTILQLNNWLTLVRRGRVAPAHVLLLVPHCLQRSRCDAEVDDHVDRCRRCGQCDLAGVLALRDRYGLRCELAGGGRQALAAVKRPEVKVVVAVACEPELVAGILAAFPRPVFAVVNRRPHGPCKDTCVDLERTEQAIRRVIRKSDLPAEQEPVDSLQGVKGNGNRRVTEA